MRNWIRIAFAEGAGGHPSENRRSIRSLRTRTSASNDKYDCSTSQGRSQVPAQHPETARQSGMLLLSLTGYISAILHLVD